jgi:hypothetical protein
VSACGADRSRNGSPTMASRTLKAFAHRILRQGDPAQIHGFHKNPTPERAATKKNSGRISPVELPRAPKVGRPDHSRSALAQVESAIRKPDARTPTRTPDAASESFKRATPGTLASKFVARPKNPSESFPKISQMSLPKNRIPKTARCTTFPAATLPQWWLKERKESFQEV